MAQTYNEKRGACLCEDDEDTMAFLHHEGCKRRMALDLVASSGTSVYYSSNRYVAFHNGLGYGACCGQLNSAFLL